MSPPCLPNIIHRYKDTHLVLVKSVVTHVRQVSLLARPTKGTLVVTHGRSSSAHVTDIAQAFGVHVSTRTVSTLIAKLVILVALLLAVGHPARVKE